MHLGGGGSRRCSWVCKQHHLHVYISTSTSGKPSADACNDATRSLALLIFFGSGETDGARRFGCAFMQAHTFSSAWNWSIGLHV